MPEVITIYDPACGSGGMLTEAQNFIKNPKGEIKASGDVYLYGKEINDFWLLTFNGAPHWGNNCRGIH